MACGDRYRKQIRTSNGYTLDNLCGMVCVPEDYDAWKNTADKWWGYVKRAWEQLATVSDREGKPFPDELARQLLTYQKEHDALPSSLFTSAFETGEVHLNTTWVERAAGNTADGACMLEQLEGLISRYGGKPLPVPTQPGKPKPPDGGDGPGLLTVAPWLVLGGVALGAYVLWKVK